MRIRYLCHYGALTGYGRAARDYLAALALLPDVELQIVPLGRSRGAPQTSPEGRYAHLDRFVVAGSAELAHDVEIVHTAPFGCGVRIDRVDDARPTVAMTTWETSPMPASVAEPLSRYDAVIVPSTWCQRIVSDSLQQPIAGGEPPVFALPHCYDPAFWVPTPWPVTDVTRFYAIGAWGERKNLAGVLKAYLHAFTRADDVHLELHISDPDLVAIKSLLACSGLPPDMLPRLTVLDRDLTEIELLELHRRNHCFVTATRGEAWGLGMFEAACMGRGVIAPHGGGQLDFLEEEAFRGGSNTHLIRAALTPCVASARQDRAVAGGAVVDLARGVDARQVWHEPNLVELGHRMREVHRTRDVRRASSAAALRRFDYATIGPRLLHLLKGLA